MGDVKEWIEIISKAVLRTAFGVFLVFVGIGIVKVSSRDEPKINYIVPKVIYDSNEKKYDEEIKDKIIDYYNNLDPDAQRTFLDSLANEYKRRNMD